MTKYGELRALRLKFMTYIDKLQRKTWGPYNRKIEIVTISSDEMTIQFEKIEGDTSPLYSSYEDFLRENNIKESDFA